MSTSPNSPSNGSPVLNVILHGAFALVYDRGAQKIDVWIPPVKHHVFRAGNWLGETELSRRDAEYELKGATPGHDEFNSRLNLFVKPQNPTKASSARTKLSFPIPEHITSLRVAEVPRDKFKNQAGLDVRNPADPNEHIATLQVFSYHVDDENKLLLQTKDGDGHYWEPVVTTGPDKREFINLHVFSAEDHFTKLSNSEEDFNRCTELLGSQLLLDTRLVPSGIPDRGHLPAGVTEPETEGLAERTLRMARLGRLVTQNGDANLAWYGNDALDGNPQACGGPVSDGGK
jgi:hypothetical protein